jgi:hypothetical protein
MTTSHPTSHLTSRAQRLIEEFEQGDSVREGIANVLLHLAAAWDSYSDDSTLHGVSTSLLGDFSEGLTAPTLLDRALSGDRAAARKFLQDFGVIDANGNLTAPYKNEEDT